MIPITVELMKELIVKKINAKSCRRCGGSGIFRTIQKYDGIKSRFGPACFDCGDAYKVPRLWTILDSSKKAEIFKGLPSMEMANTFINELLDVSLLKSEEADLIRIMIKKYDLP